MLPDEETAPETGTEAESAPVPAETPETAAPGEPSLLNRGEESPKEETPAEGATDDKPAEAPEEKPADEPKPEEPAPEEKPEEPEQKAEAEPPPPLTYEPPTLPEGVALDSERLGEFDRVVGEAQVPPESRQQLIDMLVAERQRWEAAAMESWQTAFAQTRRQWRNEVMADEALGGANHQDALAACLRMVDEFVPEDQRAAFDQMLIVTGAGDHPAMMRFLHTVARKFDAPGTPPVPNGPPPDNGRAPGRRRMRDMYDHPRSRM